MARQRSYRILASTYHSCGLSLEYEFVSSDLVAFITVHGDTLGTMTFTNCYSLWPGEDYIT
jgi:hypothetical protein